MIPLQLLRLKQIFLVLLCLSPLIRDATCSCNFEKVYSELEKLQKNQEILLNELQRLAQANAAAAPKQTSDPVTLLSAERISSDESTELVLTYTRNVENVHHEVSVNYKSAGAVEEDIGDGKKTLRIPFDYNSSESRIIIYAVFTTEDESSRVKFEFNGASQQALSQISIKMPVLDVHIEGDLVYYVGGDAELMVTSSASDDPTVGFTDLKASLVGVDIGSMTYGNKDHLVEITKKKQFIETTESVVKVKTSRLVTSGFLNFTMKYTDSMSKLLVLVQTERRITIRPFNQTGAFPGGFLAFDHPTNRIKKYCEDGKQCSMSCKVLGQSISDLRVIKKEEGGNWTEVMEATLKEKQYATTAEWTIRADATVGNVTYRCEAEDETHATNATYDIELTTFTTNLTFVPEKSGYVISDNGYRFTLHCVVQGGPVISGFFEFRGYVYDTYRALWCDDDGIVPMDGNPLETELTVVAAQITFETHQTTCKAFLFNPNEPNRWRIFEFEMPKTALNRTNIE